ncbi:hypothetical protein [Lentzea sp. NPDC059081]|uniref:WXG100-like domain-containing protein n=1 Tax=Lentzea sp. NPDC059081 TaxID=3346719 RepID=UPI003678B001
MHVRFDPAFDWFWVIIAGSKAPRVDVEAARALADRWDSTGATLESMAADLQTMAMAVERSVGGVAGRTFRENTQELLKVMPTLVGVTGQQSAALRNLALSVEQTNYSMLIEIISYAWSILVALSNPFTAPWVGGLFTSARIAITRLAERLHWTVTLIRKGLQEGVDELAQGAAVQLLQFAEGNRHSWDGTSSLIDFTAGTGAGTWVAAGHMLAKKYTPHFASTFVFHGLNQGVAEGVVDVAAVGILGGGYGDAWTGAVGGAFTGASGKLAHDAGIQLHGLVGSLLYKGPGQSGADGLGEPTFGKDEEGGGGGSQPFPRTPPDDGFPRSSSAAVLPPPERGTGDSGAVRPDGQRRGGALPGPPGGDASVPPARGAAGTGTGERPPEESTVGVQGGGVLGGGVLGGGVLGGGVLGGGVQDGAVLGGGVLGGGVQDGAVQGGGVLGGGVQDGAVQGGGVLGGAVLGGAVQGGAVQGGGVPGGGVQDGAVQGGGVPGGGVQDGGVPNGDVLNGGVQDGGVPGGGVRAIDGQRSDLSEGGEQAQHGLTPDASRVGGWRGSDLDTVTAPVEGPIPPDTADQEGLAPQKPDVGTEQDPGQRVVPATTSASSTGLSGQVDTWSADSSRGFDLDWSSDSSSSTASEPPSPALTELTAPSSLGSPALEPMSLDEVDELNEQDEQGLAGLAPGKAEPAKPASGHVPGSPDLTAGPTSTRREPAGKDSPSHDRADDGGIPAFLLGDAVLEPVGMTDIAVHRVSVEMPAIDLPPVPAESKPLRVPAEGTHGTREQVAVPAPAAMNEAGESVPDRAPMEDVLRGTSVLVDEHGPAVISFPVTRRGGTGISAETLARNVSKLGPGDVAVTASVRGDGRIMFGDREIPLLTFAEVIRDRADGKRVVLTMPGGSGILPGLRELLGGDVVVVPRGHEVEPEPVDFDVSIPSVPSASTAAPSLTSQTGSMPSGSVLVPGSSDGANPASAETSSFPTWPGDPTTSGTGTTVPGAVDPAIISIGVPRAGLPAMAELISALRGLVTGPVTEATWHGLHQYLLSNYRYTARAAGSPDLTGVPVQIGGQEVLISLELEYGGKVERPAGAHAVPEEAAEGTGNFKAVGSINSVFRLGSHEQKHTGTLGSTRASLNAEFGFGLAAGPLQLLAIGAGFSVALNQQNRSTNRIIDAEGGHVEDNRTSHTMLHYNTRWVVRSRDALTTPWSSIMPTSVPVRGDDDGRGKLLLWVPDHYLAKPSRQFVATNLPEGKEGRIPDYYFASGLTNLPMLYDLGLAELAKNGVDPRITDMIRGELAQKLWNLDANLDHAVNNPRGYAFDLHDDHGRPIVSASVHTVVDDQVRPVGAPSSESHLENVRTAIDGTGGSHTLGQSYKLSLPSVTAGLRGLAGIEGGLNINFTLALTKSRSDGIGTAQNGLWVVVPRFAGWTSAYHRGFQHFIRFTIRGGDYRETPVTPLVPSKALIRIPEIAAYDHGFPVDVAALRDPAVLPRQPEGARGQAEITHAPGLVRNRRTADPEPDQSVEIAAPGHFVENGAIGAGLVEIGQETVDDLLGLMVPELRKHGFVSQDSDAMRAQRWWRHGDELDSKVDNEALLYKMISRNGIESNWDLIHQDGLTFTLQLRRGVAGMTLDVDSVVITVTARPSESHDAEFLGTTDQFTATTLAMGMGVYSYSTSAGKKLSLSLKLKGLAKMLKSVGGGGGYVRGYSASNSVTHLNNLPALFEYPGELSGYQSVSDFTVVMEFQHSGLQGDVLKGRRDPVPRHLPGQAATAAMIPFDGDGDLTDRPAAFPPQTILKHGAVFYLDSTGVRPALRGMLDSLVGPAGYADQEINTFTSNIVLKAFIKEIVNGEFSTDQFFEPGWLLNTHGAADVRGDIGLTRYVGSTNSPFVLGIIKLSLSVAGDSSTRSHGFTWEQAGFSLGEADPEGLTGGAEGGANRSWTRNRTKGMSRTGAEELIQLDFNRAYAFESFIDLTVTAKEEKHAKLWSSPENGRQDTLTRTMRFVLSEPEALDRHADREVSVTRDQLADAMTRWASRELSLSGNVVAGVLSRWAGEDAVNGLAPDPRVRQWAQTLAEVHREGGLGTISNEERRTAFRTAFGIDPDRGTAPFSELTLPEYMSRPGTQKNFLGHSGVDDVQYRDPVTDATTTLFKEVKALVDQQAPGLLSGSTELWVGGGRQIGRLQGGTTSLQAILAGGRDHSLWGDLLSGNGVTLYLVNPVNWVLSEMVEINLLGTLTSLPEIIDQKQRTGIEKYIHAYSAQNSGRSRDGAQSFGIKGGPADDGKGGGTAAFGTGEGHHRGTTRSETMIAEQTVYDWFDHFLARFLQEVRISVRKLDMNGMSVNNFLLHHGPGASLRPDHPDAALVKSVPGTLDLQVPRSIAESRRIIGPSRPAFLKVHPLLGDTAVVGALLDDIVPAQRAVMRTMFGATGDTTNAHVSLNPSVLLSRTHINAHLHEAVGGRRYQIAENLIVPGRPGERASLWLVGDLYDAEAISEFTGAGAGRYSKSLESTSSSSSADHWRGSAELGGGGGVPIDPAAAHKFTADSAQNRSSPAGQGLADNVNFRREQHVKQLAEKPAAPGKQRLETISEDAELELPGGDTGRAPMSEKARGKQKVLTGKTAPVTNGAPATVPGREESMVLTRFRGRFRIVAESHAHHLGKSTPTLTGRFTSEAVTGDVFAHIFRSELEEVIAQAAPADRAVLRPSTFLRTLPTAKTSAVAAVAKGMAATAAELHRLGHRPTFLVVSHGDQDVANAAGRTLAKHLRRRFGRRHPDVTLSDVDIRVRHGARSDAGAVSILLGSQDEAGRLSDSPELAALTDPLNLTDVLTEAAAGGTVFNAHEAVTAEVRAQISGDLPVTLELDRDAVARSVLPAALRWAADRVRASLPADTRPHHPDLVIAGDYETLAAVPEVITDPITLFEDAVQHVTALDSVLGPRRPPVQLPSQAAFLALDAPSLASEVAFALDAPVRIVEVALDGTRSTWRATPDGHLTQEPRLGPPGYAESAATMPTVLRWAALRVRTRVPAGARATHPDLVLAESYDALAAAPGSVLNPAARLVAVLEHVNDVEERYGAGRPTWPIPVQGSRADVLEVLPSLLTWASWQVRTQLAPGTPANDPDRLTVDNYAAFAADPARLAAIANPASFASIALTYVAEVRARRRTGR